MSKFTQHISLYSDQPNAGTCKNPFSPIHELEPQIPLPSRNLPLTAAPSVMQSYPARALDRRLQVDWAIDPREGPRVLMSLRVDFEPMG